MPRLNLVSTSTSAPKTAVLLFAQTLEVEARERFADVAPGQRQLWLKGLRAQLSATLEASGLPVIASTERDQCGDSFGERLKEACQCAFEQGFAHLIVVGGDCPGLRSAHLLRAAQLLESGRAVLGRDRRGGVYLMGLTCAGLDQQHLAKLPYRAPGFAEAFSDLLCAQHAQAPVELAPLGDVHYLTDLLHEGQHLGSACLQLLLRSLSVASARRSGLTSPIQVARHWTLRARSRRGPPVAMFALV